MDCNSPLGPVYSQVMGYYFCTFLRSLVSPKCALNLRDSQLMMVSYRCSQLDAMLAKSGHNIDRVLNFDIPDSVLEERITGRWVHLASGRSYHTKFAPPKVPGKDDVSVSFNLMVSVIPEYSWIFCNPFKPDVIQNFFVVIGAPSFLRQNLKKIQQAATFPKKFYFTCDEKSLFVSRWQGKTWFSARTTMLRCSGADLMHSISKLLL